MSSEWGRPEQFENGVVPEDLLANKYGHRLHFWDLRKRRLDASVDIGPENQMLLELGPAHDPRKTHDSPGWWSARRNLSASIWTWFRENGEWLMRKVITIPAEPADAEDLHPLAEGVRGPFRRWSPISISPLTTGFSTSRAGVLASCISTTFPIHSGRF